jgi:hypothetical protein
MRTGYHRTRTLLQSKTALLRPDHIKGRAVASNEASLMSSDQPNPGADDTEAAQVASWQVTV